MGKDRRKLLVGLVGGLYVVVLIICVLGSIYLSGGTFGHRCRQIHADKSIGFNQCVEDLSKGRDVTPK